jgi:hypothetical protein
MPTEAEECLSRLPKGTPISRGAFEMGFYIQNGLIKYRTSLLSAIRSSKGCLAELLFMLWFAAGVFFLCMDAFFFATACFLVALGEKICYAIQYSLRPPFGFDVEKRVLRHGRFFVKDIPFENINCVFVLENYVFYRTMGFGTHVYINYAAVYEYFTAKKHFLIMKFHVNEKQFADLFADSIKVILNKNVEIKREVRGEKNKIQY